MKTGKAFTMVELVFVIVVIGILSAFAIPKLAVTRDDADIIKAKTTISSLRNAISMERQKRILSGDFTDINVDDAKKLLLYGLGPNWSKNEKSFIFKHHGKTCSFTLANNILKKDSNCSIEGLNNI